MASVFHYTDSAGLLGILSSRSLFATHYRYLNDISEGSLIRELILPILENEIIEINFCLHTEENTIKHGLLSQWRGYAGSAGFAIEFDEPELCELIRVENDTYAYP